jgi:hypothetical protein
MKRRSKSKGTSTSVEGGVLTGVAQKLGTAVGTVVSALSHVSEPAAKKTRRMSAGKSGRSGLKSSGRRAKTETGKTGTEHSPLKRRRIKSR